MDGFDTLELSTETLRELTPDEMAQVAGGAQPQMTPSCPLFLRIQEMLEQASVRC